jgi:hypothetical protein
MDIGREHSPIQSRFREPFGDVGNEIAQFAGLLIQSLSTDPEAANESGNMLEEDSLALEYWLELEHLVPIVAVPEELDGDVRKAAHDALSTLHTATPFSEAERGWLLQVARQTTPRRVETFPGLVETQESQIMSAGIKLVVTGRDLMRRWTAWRRGQDEFEGQGGLDQAREALVRIQELMS